VGRAAHSCVVQGELLGADAGERSRRQHRLRQAAGHRVRGIHHALGDGAVDVERLERCDEGRLAVVAELAERLLRDARHGLQHRDAQRGQRRERSPALATQLHEMDQSRAFLRGVQPRIATGLIEVEVKGLARRARSSTTCRGLMVFNFVDRGFHRSRASNATVVPTPITSVFYWSLGSRSLVPAQWAVTDCVRSAQCARAPQPPRPRGQAYPYANPYFSSRR
jgi:hypothetical protein